MEVMPDKPAGLYVHIPFCLRKCPYCDFYSISDLSQTPGFLAALKQEMQLNSGTSLVFDTLYIGGGTPSVLAPRWYSIRFISAAAPRRCWHLKQSDKSLKQPRGISASRSMPK
jgi:oxygen-independent coproporphyrinogen-3 oxidase